VVAIVDDATEVNSFAHDIESEVIANESPAHFVDASVAKAIEQALRARPGVTLIATVESMADAEWQRLDRARTRLEGNGDTRIVFVMSQATAARAANAAPNLWSFLSSALHHLAAEEPLSAEDTEERLDALREHYAMSDAQLIALAERGDAPRDPGVVEWLILIGRTDLLHQSNEA